LVPVLLFFAVNMTESRQVEVKSDIFSYALIKFILWS
jgi:hypothetical protein